MTTIKSEYQVIELDAVDGKIVYRNFSNTESAQYEIDLATHQAQKQEAEAQAAAKAALLDRLGITEDEAKLLLS